MIECYFDGACEPMNPGGNMGLGALILHNGKEVFKHCEFIPANETNSNNVAEYMALEKILIFLSEFNMAGNELYIKGDSMMVIMQMKGKWRIKQGRYKDAALRCKELVNGLNIAKDFFWVSRYDNEPADMLSKKELLKNNVAFKIQPM